MIFGKKYRVLPDANFREEILNAIVVLEKLNPLTVRLLHPAGLLHRGQSFWCEEHEVELIPEELQNESIETILLYYSL